MKLAELLHFCLTAKRSGVIQFSDSSLEGTIYIQEGEVIAARYKDIEGEEAFFAMLLIQSGQSEFVEGPVTETASISKSTHYLLMEAARISDEVPADTSSPAFVSPKPHKPKAKDFCLNFITLDNAKFSLQGETIIIGRESSCDITVPDVSVSSRHCRIIWNGKDHIIDDLESFNGTYLNGEVISVAIALNPGDDIQVGLCHFLYEALKNSDTITDPKSAVPFTFGSETQKIQLPIKHEPEHSKIGDGEKFKDFKPIKAKEKKGTIWPFGSKS